MCCVGEIVLVQLGRMFFVFRCVLCGSVVCMLGSFCMLERVVGDSWSKLWCLVCK